MKERKKEILSNSDVRISCHLGVFRPATTGIYNRPSMLQLLAK